MTRQRQRQPTLTFTLLLFTTLSASFALTNSTSYRRDSDAPNPFNPTDRPTLRHVHLPQMPPLPPPDANSTVQAAGAGFSDTDDHATLNGGGGPTLSPDANGVGGGGGGAALATPSVVNADPPTASPDSDSATTPSAPLLVARQVDPGDDDEDDGAEDDDTLVEVPAACTDECAPLMNSACENLDCECTAASASLLVQCLNCAAASGVEITEAQQAYNDYVSDCNDEDRAVSAFTVTATIGAVTVPPIIPANGTETDGGDGDPDEDEDGEDGEDEDDEDEDDVPDDDDELDETTHDDDSDDGDSDAQIRTTIVVDGTTIVGKVPATRTTVVVDGTTIVGKVPVGASATGASADAAGAGPQAQGVAFPLDQGTDQVQPTTTIAGTTPESTLASDTPAATATDAFPTNGLGVQDPNALQRHRRRRHPAKPKRGLHVFSPLAAGPAPREEDASSTNVARELGELVSEVEGDTFEDVDAIPAVPVHVRARSNAAVGMVGTTAIGVGGLVGVVACVGALVGVVAAVVDVF